MGKSPDLCIYKNKWGYLFFMAKKITQAYVAVVTQEDQWESDFIGPVFM